LGYQVVNDFVEKEHENVLYRTGDVYPKEGYAAGPERVAFLQTKTNRYKKVFLGHKIEETEKAETKSESVEPVKAESKKSSTKKKASTKE
jgi:hypothetical protein